MCINICSRCMLCMSSQKRSYSCRPCSGLTLLQGMMAHQRPSLPQPCAAMHVSTKRFQAYLRTAPSTSSTSACFFASADASRALGSSSSSSSCKLQWQPSRAAQSATAGPASSSRIEAHSAGSSTCSSTATHEHAAHCSSTHPEVSLLAYMIPCSWAAVCGRHHVLECSGMHCMCCCKGFSTSHLYALLPGQYLIAVQPDMQCHCGRVMVLSHTHLQVPLCR